MNDKRRNSHSFRVEFRIFYMEDKEYSSMFSEGSFVLKSVCQYKT